MSWDSLKRAGDGSEGLKSQLDETVRQRQAAVRRRVASIDAILGMEQRLQEERANVERARREHAVEAVKAFQERYNAAVANLQVLWEEGRLPGRDSANDCADASAGQGGHTPGGRHCPCRADSIKLRNCGG
jgi:hypothetical protein